jgi:hypothetical protein
MEQDTVPQRPPPGAITATANELAQVQALAPYINQHISVVVCTKSQQQVHAILPAAVQ